MTLAFFQYRVPSDAFDEQVVSNFEHWKRGQITLRVVDGFVQEINLRNYFGLGDEEEELTSTHILRRTLWAIEETKFVVDQLFETLMYQ